MKKSASGPGSWTKETPEESVTSRNQAGEGGGESGARPQGRARTQNTATRPSRHPADASRRRRVMGWSSEQGKGGKGSCGHDQGGRGGCQGKRSRARTISTTL